MHVKSQSLAPDELVKALKQGHYYSSQGPQIHDIALSDDLKEVRIECSPATAIAMTGRGARSENTRGTDLSNAVFPLHRFLGSYARITVIDDRGRKTWSNPIWLD